MKKKKNNNYVLQELFYSKLDFGIKVYNLILVKMKIGAILMILKKQVLFLNKTTNINFI